MSLVREARQAGTSAREFVAGHVQLNRQERVIAADAGHIDHTLLSEALLGSIEDRVRYAFISLKFSREVI